MPLDIRVRRATPEEWKQRRGKNAYIPTTYGWVLESVNGRNLGVFMDNCYDFGALIQREFQEQEYVEQSVFVDCKDTTPTEVFHAFKTAKCFNCAKKLRKIVSDKNCSMRLRYKDQWLYPKAVSSRKKLQKLNGQIQVHCAKFESQVDVSGE